MGLFDDEFGGDPGNQGTGDPNETAPQGADVPTDNPTTDVSTGKHAVIFVPDFTNTLSTTQHQGLPLNSYLRLGAAHSQAGPAVTAEMVQAYNNGDIVLPAGCGPLEQHDVRVDLGEDLAAMVVGFTDDIRNRGTGSTTPTTAPDPAGQAMAPNSMLGWVPPPEAATNSNPDGDTFRLRESAILHTKGGWRDHSDGNRISTTRGDKVEVIRGNYKLLVLGRSDDTGNAVGFDMSGGEVDSATSDLARPTQADLDGQAQGTQATGLDMTWTWTSDSDGNMRWHMTTIQGDPSGASGGFSNNPTIVNQTFAFDMSSTTNANSSSTVLQVNNQVVNQTSAGSMSTSANVSGPVTNSTTAVSIANSNTAVNIENMTAALFQETGQIVGGDIVQNAMGGHLEVDMIASGYIVCQLVPFSITETTGVAIISDQNASLAITSLQAAPAIVSVTAAAATITTLTAAPIATNTFAGIQNDIHAGMHIDNHTGLHADNHAGVHLDVHTGIHLQSDDINSQTVTGTQINQVMGTHASLLASGVHVCYADMVSVATSWVKL